MAGTKTKGSEIATTTTTELETWTDEQRKVLAQMIGKDKKPAPSPAELDIFQQVCNHLGVSPFRDEIIFPDFGTGRRPYLTWKGRLVRASANSPVVRIEGPFFTADGERWLPVWLSEEHPAAAKMELYLQGASWPIVGIATWKTWAQYTDEYKDDPSGAKIEKFGKMVPKRIKTGQKVLTGWWAKGAGDYMLGIKAGNLAAELAARISGEVVKEKLENLDGGTRGQHRRMWGLVGEIETELGRKWTDEERHDVSGVDTWSGLDIDSQIEIVHLLEEYLQMLKDGAEGIEEGEIVQGVGGSPGNAVSPARAGAVDQTDARDGTTKGTNPKPDATPPPPASVGGAAGPEQSERQSGPGGETSPKQGPAGDATVRPAPAEAPVSEDQLEAIRAAFAGTEDIPVDEEVVDAEVVGPTFDQWDTLRGLAESLSWTEDEKLTKMATLENASESEVEATIEQWRGYAAALESAKKGKPAPVPAAAKQEAPKTAPTKRKAEVAGSTPALPDWVQFAKEQGFPNISALKKLLQEDGWEVSSLNGVPWDSEGGRRLQELAMSKGKEGRLL